MIRPATNQDFPQLLDIQISCIRDLTKTYTTEEIASWVGYLEREGAHRYGPYTNRVYVDKDDRIAGFVSWSQDEQECSAAIECLYILKDYRGKGAGKLLLTDAERIIPGGMTIAVRSTLNAHSFYERQGYAYKGGAVSRAGFKIALLKKKNNG